MSDPEDRVRAIAFFLPQFYPTPGNDEWWGPGFTEWTNVAQADPLFEGHYQPRLPADLGFYDLRVAEVRTAQADLARAHGLEGFAYWHYWFHGRRVLERPFDEVLASGEPDFGFCLSWANESWARRWHGSGSGEETLIEQAYSHVDDVAHIRWLMTAFADRRYLTVGGRPLLLVYRPHDLPDARRTTGTFREECLKAGLQEPYLVGINAHRPRDDTRPLGFDITLDFQPQLSAVPGPTEPGLKIYDYPIATEAMRRQKREYPSLPCAMVSWDNTSRRGKDGIVFINATPEAFGANLKAVAARVADRPPDERLVLVNAWNEWAEGNHLEPDERFGLGWLEALRAGLGIAGPASTGALETSRRSSGTNAAPPGAPAPEAARARPTVPSSRPRSVAAEGKVRDYLLCATQRSGSTWLTQLLWKTKALGKPVEILNGRSVMGPKARLWGLLEPDGRLSLPAYLERCRSEFRVPNGVFGAKMFWYQFDSLRRYAGWPAIFANAAVFLLLRQDVVAQAVSLYIAGQTDEWSARGTEAHLREEGRLRRASVTYDEAGIARCVRLIHWQNDSWTEFLSVNRIPYDILTYEELVEDHRAVLQRIAARCGVELTGESLELAVESGIQRDSLDSEFAERFRSESGLLTARGEGTTAQVDHEGIKVELPT